jgi:hypothetical protein
MRDEETGNCPNCRKSFVGAIEVLTTTIGGMPTVMVEETPDRNWIQCDLCGLVICKSCCKDAASGFCNACFTKAQTKRLGEITRSISKSLPKLTSG